MINTAKAIASNAKFILKFAHVIAEQSVDERYGKDLAFLIFKFDLAVKIVVCETQITMVYCFVAFFRSKSDLLYYAEFLPTISTQLKIISSVKAATPSDISVGLHV